MRRQKWLVWGERLVRYYLIPSISCIFADFPASRGNIPFGCEAWLAHYSTEIAAQGSRRGKVLIVDDSSTVREFLAAALESANYEILYSSNGVEALHAVERFKPDIVLLDVEMPRMNGLEVCRRLRREAEFALLPIIILTGNSNPNHKIEGLAAGADEYLLKPPDLTDIRLRTANFIARKQLTDQLETAEATFVTLAHTLEARCAYTHGHSERVSRYAAGLADFLGFNSEVQRIVRRAGLLHDIGKIALSEAILQKPSRLTEDEFKLVTQHPVIGAHILRDLRSAAPYLPGIRHHHERFDGRGYPDQLAGQRIPLVARILAICDSFDAMTSRRAYRSGMRPEDAVAILGENKGPQWDPDLIAAFIEWQATIPNGMLETF